MARTLDTLAEHWLETKGKRRHWTVKLGERDFTFWWSAWTLGQQDFVYHDYVQGKPFTPERCARVVVAKAEKEDGERMFADVEKVDLLSHVDPTVVKAMASAIVTDIDIDDRAALEAWAATQKKAMAAAGATPNA